MNNNWSSKNIIKIIIFFSILIFASLCIAENEATKTEKDLLKIKKEINQLDRNIKKNTEVKKDLSSELKQKEKKIIKTKKEI